MGRPDYSKGLPDYHDPTAGVGGAPEAVSALTLRLVLAAVGVAMCGVGAAATAVIGSIGWCIAFAVLGFIAAVDIGVISWRKRRGEPG